MVDKKWSMKKFEAERIALDFSGNLHTTVSLYAGNRRVEILSALKKQAENAKEFIENSGEFTKKSAKPTHLCLTKVLSIIELFD